MREIVTLLLGGNSTGPGSSKLEQVPVISIVDDDESVREATKSLVRSLGYRAATFSSAEEYLDSEQVVATACLITDVQMPGLNGLELQDRLIAGGHRTPMVFISAFPDQTVERRALRNGAIGYLRKPFREEHLIDCIEAALKRGSCGNIEP